MKKGILAAFVMCGTLFLAACPSKDSGGGGGGGGGDPYIHPGDCFRMGTCRDPRMYGGGNGFRPYDRDPYNRYMGYDSHYRDGFCGCPDDYYPTSRRGRDLGCISRNSISNSSYIAWWTWNPTNYMFIWGLYGSQYNTYNNGYNSYNNGRGYGRHAQERYYNDRRYYDRSYRPTPSRVNDRNCYRDVIPNCEVGYDREDCGYRGECEPIGGHSYREGICVYY